MDGRQVHTESMFIDFACNPDPYETERSIVVGIKKTLTNLQKMGYGQQSYPVEDLRDSSRRMSRVLVSLGQMERGYNDKEHIVRIDKTYEPNRASCQPSIRRSGSIVVSLDSGADVAKKSFESRNQMIKSKSPSPRVLNTETQEDLDDGHKGKEGHYDLEATSICEGPMQSVLGACKTHRLTNDVEPEAVEHSREYLEVILQADEGPIQREGQNCERNREASEKDMSTAADASPCDSIPSLDPHHTKRRFHPRPPEPVSSEQATIGTIPQVRNCIVDG